MTFDPRIRLAETIFGSHSSTDMSAVGALLLAYQLLTLYNHRNFIIVDLLEYPQPVMTIGFTKQLQLADHTLSLLNNRLVHVLGDNKRIVVVLRLEIIARRLQ